MARLVADPAYVAHPGTCCRGWCYMPPGSDQPEAHDLPYNPAVVGLAPVRVQRSRIGTEHIDRWFYLCHIPGCEEWCDEVAGADGWTATLRLALEHEHRPAGAAA